MIKLDGCEVYCRRFGCYGLGVGFCARGVLGDRELKLCVFDVHACLSRNVSVLENLCYAYGSLAGSLTLVGNYNIERLTLFGDLNGFG